jgi:hypothetical protein
MLRFSQIPPKLPKRIRTLGGGLILFTSENQSSKANRSPTPAAIRIDLIGSFLMCPSNCFSRFSTVDFISFAASAACWPAFSAEPSEDSNLSIQTYLSEILISIQRPKKKLRPRSQDVVITFQEINAFGVSDWRFPTRRRTPASSADRPGANARIGSPF